MSLPKCSSYTRLPTLNVILVAVARIFAHLCILRNWRRRLFPFLREEPRIDFQKFRYLASFSRTVLFRISCISRVNIGKF